MPAADPVAELDIAIFQRIKADATRQLRGTVGPAEYQPAGTGRIVGQGQELPGVVQPVGPRRFRKIADDRLIVDRGEQGPGIFGPAGSQ